MNFGDNVAKGFVECAYMKKIMRIGETGYRITKKGSVIKLYFAGCNRAEQWMRSFDFRTATYESSGVRYRIKRGFKEAFDSVKPLLDGILERGPKRVEIYGYSYGGVIAELSHEYLKGKEYAGIIETWCFDAPKVFKGRIKNPARFEGVHELTMRKSLVSSLYPLCRHPVKPMVLGSFRKLGLYQHYPTTILDELMR